MHKGKPSDRDYAPMIPLDGGVPAITFESGLDPVRISYKLQKQE